MPMQPVPEIPPTVRAATVTLVTGASSGLGRAIALRLAAAGERIIALARRREPLDALIRDIEAAGGRARAISCDVTDREQVARAVAEVESTDGPIERLVSCTGGGTRTTVAGFRAAHLEQMLSLNVMGIANCLEAVLPRMLQRRRGHIVAISSLAAARGLPGSAEHSAAKAALSTLLEGQRVELKRHGIDLTVLSPGFVRGNASKKRRPLDVPLDMAATRMVKAIERRYRSDAFPLRLVVLLAALRCIPPAWADLVVTALIRTASAPGQARPQSPPPPAA
jgi:short-subunit dehydrogenase